MYQNLEEKIKLEEKKYKTFMKTYITKTLMKKTNQLFLTLYNPAATTLL